MSELEIAINKCILLYEELDSYSNGKVREKLDEIIQMLKSINEEK